MERWVGVPGFEAYEVSDAGRVRRVICRCCGARLADPRIIKGRPDQQGYLRVVLYLGVSGKKRSDRFISKLVLRAFAGEPPSPFHQAAHGDGNRQNNSLSNLRWATPKENAHDKIRHGTHRHGRQIHFVRLTEDQVRLIRQLSAEGCPVYQIAKRTGASEGNVYNVVHRVSWKHVA